MQVTRKLIPRAHIEVNAQISHCSGDNEDEDFEETTIVVEPYWNAVEVTIGHESLTIPEFAIPEVIRMFQKHQKAMVARRQRDESKEKKK